MSTQTFSKVFLFLNNKRKIENIFLITAGPAHGNELAHDRFWHEQPSGEKGATARLGLRPKADLAQWGPGEKTAMPASMAPPQRGSRPMAVAGHDRARRSAHGSTRGRRT
jgi:hypothetical protein